jgi:tRNA nucleotidyltransferase (CCA-adding enzyme)
MPKIDLSQFSKNHQAIINLVAAQAQRLNLRAYLVGGFVRDALIAYPSDDIDIAVAGDAIVFAEALKKLNGGKITAHKKFKTAVWHYNSDERYIDLASARKETYSQPAALPTVTFSDLREDLARRDFSINALAMSLNAEDFGDMFDFYNAKSDLENKIIRVLHKNSFIDDPTRLFRAVRYEQRYGFQIEPNTLRLIPAALKHISALSAARILHELDLILDEPHAVRMLARLQELNILKAIDKNLNWKEPESSKIKNILANPLEPAWDLENIPAVRCALGYAFWFADLNPQTIDVIHKRLKFPAEEIKIIRETARLKDDLQSIQSARPSQWTERLETIPLIAVYAVYQLSEKTELKDFALKWRFIKAITDGETLKAKGLKPSPKFKKILSALRAARLDGIVTSDIQENNLLESLLKSEI